MEAIEKLLQLKENQDGILDETEDPVLGLICVAAQKAFENKSHAIATKALNCIVKESKDLKSKLTVIR